MHKHAKVWVGEHAAASQVMRTALVDFFTTQAIQLARLVKRGAGLIADQIFDSTEWTSKLKSCAIQPITRVVLTGAESELNNARLHRSLPTLQKSDDIQSQLIRLPPTVRDAIELFLRQTMEQPWWADVVKAVRDDLAQALIDHIHSGENLSEGAQRIQTVLIGASKARAELITRTEVCGSLNSGHQAVREHLQTIGVIKGKQWLSIVDPRTRPSHVHANGQTVGVSEMFTLGSEKCLYPGDQKLSVGERANCRCTAISVLVDPD